MNVTEELLELMEKKKLSRVDIKSTERKMEKDVTDLIDNDEISFLNNFLKKGEKIDGKTIKSIDMLISKYKKKIGSAKARTDSNLMMLAPILASIQSELNK